MLEGYMNAPVLFPSQAKASSIATHHGGDREGEIFSLSSSSNS